MIIVGTYPESLEVVNSSFKIKQLTSKLKKLLPLGIGVHLLPFYYSSGDFGFAPNDWFTVRKDLGDWNDILLMTNHWKIIVDGIYNHVGIEHKWVSKFLRQPEKYKNYFYAYSNISLEDGPMSPRGVPVLRKNDTKYLLWQTFSEIGVDINLNHKKVRKEISDHLRLLKSINIWGIRLDAVAYYSKKLGNQVRHNSGSYQLTESIADIVLKNRLKALAQLDCDEDGLKYFDSKTQNNIPLSDFTFSIYLLLSFYHENAEILHRHLHKNIDIGRIIIRSPRNHDGILLRSKFLEEKDLSDVFEFTKKKNVQVRITNDNPYEINNSGPYLLSKIFGKTKLFQAILLSMAITGMTSGWSYFYLPYLMGKIPEKNLEGIDLSDPRAINRISVTFKEQRDFIQFGHFKNVKKMLKLLQEIHDHQGAKFKSTSVARNSMLEMTTSDGQFRLVANFSHTKNLTILNIKQIGKILYSQNFNDYRLAKLGFIIFKVKH